jgi:hypothetical protein
LLREHQTRNGHHREHRGTKDTLSAIHIYSPWRVILTLLAPGQQPAASSQEQKPVARSSQLSPVPQTAAFFQVPLLNKIALTTASVE